MRFGTSEGSSLQVRLQIGAGKQKKTPFSKLRITTKSLMLILAALACLVLLLLAFRGSSSPQPEPQETLGAVAGESDLDFQIGEIGEPQ